MPGTFTLDTNCLIDIEENRPAAGEVRALADAHAAGIADVAVIAMSASEKQKDGHHVRNFSEFQDRLMALGLAHLKIVLPMLCLDISFLDHCLLVDDVMIDLERQIHSILFPNVQFLWKDFCRSNGIPWSNNIPYSKWRNYKCDVQAIWSHINSGRSTFVTSDSNFHALNKKASLLALGAGRIERPQNALLLL